MVVQQMSVQLYIAFQTNAMSNKTLRRSTVRPL
jgi:hypothetical protein